MCYGIYGISSRNTRSKIAYTINKCLINSNENEYATIFLDSQVSIAVSKNPVYHLHSEHADFSSEIQNGTEMLNYIPPEKNDIDLCTNRFSRVKLKKSFNALNGAQS